MKNKGIIAEIMRKTGQLTTANVLLGSHDNHIFAKHIGIDTNTLRKRALKTEEKMASSFRAEKDMQASLDAFAKNLYNLERIAELVSKDFYGRTSEEIIADYEIGVVVSDEGDIFETEICRFVLDFKGEDYRNRFTGMPFDIVSCYPVE